MNESWITVLSVFGVSLGVLAELVLLRSLVREARAGAGGGSAASREGEDAKVRGPSSTHGRCALAGATAMAACGLLAAPSLAQDQTPPPAKGQPEAVAAGQPSAAPGAAEKSALSVQINVDYTSAYFYHGIVQEDTGFILQPAAKLTMNLYEKDETKVDVFFGTWNSFHGQKTGARTHGDFSEYWYESDLIAGAALTQGKFSLSGQYVFLTSPSDAYETVEELDFTFGFDDSDVLGKFALHPYATLGIETGADASDGADSDTGVYLELGIAPGFSFDAGKTPVTITFPVAVGLSLSNYYQDSAGDDDTFGFAQAGVKASIPLPIGERYGKWTLNAGVSVMVLGDHTREYNADQRTQLIGTIGVQLNF